MSVGVRDRRQQYESQLNTENINNHFINTSLIIVDECDGHRGCTVTHV